jgi:hypothetical protein
MPKETKTEQMLREAREAIKPISGDIPHLPDQVRPPKCKPPCMKPSPPSPETTWASGRDPFAPASVGSNLEKWEAFDWSRHPKLRAAKPVIVDWYNDLPGSGALVLAGDVGCGKTHLADAMADLYGRWRLSFYEEIELIKHIQDTYGSKDASEEKIFRDLFRPDLLILDDLGTYETGNMAFLSNVYNRIFNQFVTVNKKPILITTNLPMFLYDGEGNVIPGGMSARIGARSFSRLCDALGKREEGRYIDLFGVSDCRVEGYLG